MYYENVWEHPFEREMDMKERRERNFRILEFRENKFDIIGDVHGCYDELMELIEKLGYVKGEGCYVHPEGRKLMERYGEFSRDVERAASAFFALHFGNVID